MKVLVVWLVVLLPLGWGVARSVQKSLPLFMSELAPAAQAPR